jgi:dipeptidyl aminopeptidase/acylaminoacyl peptidase
MRVPSTLAAAALLLLAACAAPAAEAPLVPRAVLFGEFTDDSPSLSPDGTRIVWARRGADGVVNQWVRDLATGAERQMTHDSRGVHHARWSPDGRRLLYLDDGNGDENQHLFALDLESGESRDLTPFAGARVEGIHADARRPDELLVGLNRRDPRAFDLHRVNLVTGEVTLDTENPGDVIEWATDEAFRVLGATALRAHDAATILRVRDDERSPWRDLVTWEPSVAGFDRYRRIVGFTDGGASLLVQSFAGHNTSALVKLDARTGAETQVLAHDPRTDLWNLALASDTDAPEVLFSPDGSRLLAVAFEFDKPWWKVVDPSVRADFRAIEKLAAGAAFRIESRDRADRQWILWMGRDTNPGRYVLWDRTRRRATTLFEIAPELSRWTFAPMEPVSFRARDGLVIGGWLTRPPGATGRVPMVVVVHGGPWARDTWGWSPEVQWLANRGYAVLQVNYRGSTGRGVRYFEAANGEFGPGAVLHDIVDGARWAVAQGIADSTRTGILGWSFGGYATLCALAFEPQLFACGVDGVGPSRVSTLLGSMPPYWGPRKERWRSRMGPADTDSVLDRRLSPLFHSQSMRAPLLIGHGANDPRVKLAESEAIVSALRSIGREVTFVVYPDEGHGFGRSENNQDFYGRVEQFLSKHLGGRAEPSRDVPGASTQIR